MMRRVAPRSVLLRCPTAASLSVHTTTVRLQVSVHAPSGMYAGNIHDEEASSLAPGRIAEIGAGQFNVEKPAFAGTTAVPDSLMYAERKQLVDHHTDVENPSVNCGGVDCTDGNGAVAHVAYALSDTAFIYPITPSSPMGEVADQLAASGRINCFGQVLSITEMQSEGGAAGALHGALTAGALATTFTASQGLLLMIPNMYKIAGEFHPCVIHVAARTLATHALSIFGDHSDVMAVRQVGWTMLCSENVQMSHDFAILAHLCTLESRVPVLHFFDGFRTSHEINDVQLVDYTKLKELIPNDLVEAHRQRALSPMRPQVQGTAQGPDVYFQASEAGNSLYDNVTKIMNKWAEKVEQLTGRRHAFFSYKGNPNAEDVIVVMGSGAETVSETVRYLNRLGRSVGVIKVRLFRPWSAEMFAEALPQTCRRITILDRSKEPGSLGEPLYLDVAASLLRTGRAQNMQIFAGRYGLSSKEFTPGMVIAVFDNMIAVQPKPKFTVGITDDVTNLSLPYDPSMEPNLLPTTTTQCLFYGLGSDGTVGANKTAIKLLTHHTKLHTQAYFSYDAKKSGGVTVSHLRIGSEPIRAPYLVSHADYLAVHRSTYLQKYDVLQYLKPGGIFVINTTSTEAELSNELPARAKRQLHQKRAKLYIINANKIASVTGMGKMINMIMQTAFFKLCPVLPFAEALEILKQDIHKTYAKKSDAVIRNNIQAVELAGDHVVSVPIPAEWASAMEPPPGALKALIHARNMVSTQGRSTLSSTIEYANRITAPCNALKGDSLPVSAFAPGGRAALATTDSEKRCIALKVPEISMSKCTQCNYCSFVCPHASIRPFLMTNDEVREGPERVRENAVPAQGGGVLDKYKYMVQVSPMDCTGCELCARVCPSDAIKMRDVEEAIPMETPSWDYLVTLPNRGEELDHTTVKGSQFQQPLLEFSGACEGCGETAYVKLLTQLVGERLVIANATGCSSIWGASSPSVPYTYNSHGEGPAWANSLFEDNAEFGFGMRRGYKQRREQFLLLVDDALNDPSVVISSDLRSLLERYSELRHSVKHDMLLGKGRSLYHEMYRRILPLLNTESAAHPKLAALLRQCDMFSRFSHWIIGGDGWAYDIGFGGLDHVLASEEHCKVMVLDTEMYSNTGGQASKSTPTGATAKFAESGKIAKKKDLGQYAMTYRNVYVASICLEANHKQAVKAILEAEAYPGPAIILCYSPCISHGFPMSQSLEHTREAVESGYWPLYRFNPVLRESGNNPFQLDSRTIRGDLYHFLSSENRFSAVQRSNPTLGHDLNEKLRSQISERQSALKTMETVDGISRDGRSVAAADGAPATQSSAGGPQVTILYGSETGNAEDVAKSLDSDMKCRGVSSEVVAMNDFDFDRLPSVQNLIVVCSTCGLGEFPSNSRSLWKHLSTPSLGMTYLANVKFTVFGLGDSHYSQFCAAAAAFDVRLEELGATRVLQRGVGDDQAEEKFFTGWDQWTPSLFKALNTPPEPADLGKPAPVLTVDVRKGRPVSSQVASWVPPGAVAVNRTTAHLLTPPEYDRDVRHYEFDIRGSGLTYTCGDSLAIFPHTNQADVARMCALFQLNAEDALEIIPLGEYHTVIPTETTVGALFASVLNISGRPSRRFFHSAALYATDPKDKKLLTQLGSDTDPLGQALRCTYVENKVNFIDTFAMFPSCRPSIAELIPMVPRIKPRLYSISSSPAMYPDAIHTTIVGVDWEYRDDKAAKTEKRFGLSTSYLREMAPQSKFAVQVMKSAIVLPKSTEAPVIMVGMGTGIAPWRALSQQKAYEKRHGATIGPVRLYFGARKEAQEFLYREEFKQYEKEGVLTLRTAFSRDQAAKIYVQHRLEEDGAIIFDLMHNKKGHFYVCGSARQLPVDIYNSMKNILLKHGGSAVTSEADADALLASWKMQGRYTVEAFS